MASGSGRAGAPSRSQQAFAWLLENERDASADGGSRQRPKAGGSGGGRSTKGKGGQQKSSGSSSKPPFIPGFKLRCEAEAEAAGTAQHPADELTSLQEAFRSVLDGDVVADVLVSCGGDTAAASEALLALAGSGSSGDAQAEPAGAKQPQRAAAEEPRLLASERPAASGGPCYWDVLPAEIKALVFEQLSLRCVLVNGCAGLTFLPGFCALLRVRAVPLNPGLQLPSTATPTATLATCLPAATRAGIWHVQHGPAASLLPTCASSGAVCALWWCRRACR